MAKTYRTYFGWLNDAQRHGTAAVEFELKEDTGSRVIKVLLSRDELRLLLEVATGYHVSAKQEE